MTLLAPLIRSIWKNISTTKVYGIHRLELLTRLPWLTSFIKNVAVELSWDPALDEAGSHSNWHSEIRGELGDYLFRDRQEVLNRLIEAYYQDGKLAECTQGPDHQECRRCSSEPRVFCAAPP